MNSIKVKMTLILMPLLGVTVFSSTGYYGTNYVLSAPAVGTAGSTAVHMSSNAIVSWASGYTNLVYGADVAAEWKTPALALGPATGLAEDVVVLGRGGQITLTFPAGIGNGPGADFVVFENSFDGLFLELAYIEVSSDGINFVRFPNYSYTPASIPAFGDVITELIYGLASKYIQAYGTPFDLQELVVAYDAELAGLTDFSSSYANMLTNKYPLLDLDQITHVRLVDVVGDGSTSLDSRGQPIYDPYPTIISAGYDLDAVGVINESSAVIEAGPQISIISADAFFSFEYTFDQSNFTNTRIETSADLSIWSNAVPDTIDESTNGLLVSTVVQFPLDATNRFFRVQFEGP